MLKILGIDTGGTYTDGVIIQADTKVLLHKTKTLTTKYNLHVCISKCIHAFDTKALQDISLVCLSTTIATNAIVEGHGCKEGLILIGGKPSGRMPTDRYRILQGRCDICGRLIEHLVPEEVDEVIESFRGRVESLAVSGYASVRNPEHEIYVKERIREKLGIPVVCAHDLTSSLGFYDRTVTADLNAKLIPMVCELIDSVKNVLQEHHIAAPLMIVKGDGTLMTEEQAKDKPIDTILSGPAASIMGGKFLSHKTDAIIMDMGGTTTDLAHVVKGNMVIRKDGAKVGGWLTRIKAAEVYTIGLGGDSRIYLDSQHHIKVGPQKSLPLCMMGKQFPCLYKELQGLYNDSGQIYRHFRKNEIEAYILVREYSTIHHTKEEKLLIEEVRHEPHTLHYLMDKLDMDNMASRLDNLVRLGVLARISLTPTDILHVYRIYNEWDRNIALLGLKIISHQQGMHIKQCVVNVRCIITQLIRNACIQGAVYFDRHHFETKKDDAIQYFINRVFSGQGNTVLGGNCFLKKPIVAIGAPVKAWVGDLEKELQTEVYVPENAEVANAIGAAVGQHIEKAEILIRNDLVSKKYIAFSKGSRKSFSALQEATEYAKELGKLQIAEYLLDGRYETLVNINDVEIEGMIDKKKKFIERVVQVTGIARS